MVPEETLQIDNEDYIRYKINLKPAVNLNIQINLTNRLVVARNVGSVLFDKQLLHKIT